MQDLTLADIRQLQSEAGFSQEQLRLRAILAERRVKELEMYIQQLIGGSDESDAEPSSQDVPEGKEVVLGHTYGPEA